MINKDAMDRKLSNWELGKPATVNLCEIVYDQMNDADREHLLSFIMQACNSSERMRRVANDPAYDDMTAPKEKK